MGYIHALSLSPISSILKLTAQGIGSDKYGYIVSMHFIGQLSRLCKRNLLGVYMHRPLKNQKF